MRLWNIHATIHGISALSIIRFIDIKLVKCNLSPLRRMVRVMGWCMARAYVHLRCPGSTKNQEPTNSWILPLCAMTWNEPVSLCPRVTCHLEPRRQVACPAAPWLPHLDHMHKKCRARVVTYIAVNRKLVLLCEFMDTKLSYGYDCLSSRILIGR
jgi:hypothetical protein